ncbi:carboxyl-terminal processing protease [Oxalobacteraceae bacterium GrIS 1.18]
MKKIIIPILFAAVLVACGGGGGGGGNASSNSGATGSSSSAGSGSGGSAVPTASSYNSLGRICASPRAATVLDPDTGQPYGDTQGTLTNEMAWIASFVNTTYLWYADVKAVDSTPYKIGATVPYVDPATNTASPETLQTNYDVVDAYFNSQRSPLFTATGKPKDQFHFTYTTSDWQAFSTQGNQAGFGFTVAILAADRPRQNVIAYVTPGSLADTNGLKRGMQFISINAVDFATGSDVGTINEGLFYPILGKQYTFVTAYPNAVTQTTVTLTAATVTEKPVMNVTTLSTPAGPVGYVLFNDHIATAESELFDAITTLKTAGITDLVLDLRYNGGGLLELASEVAYMIADPKKTANTVFEIDKYNDKNPFGFTAADTTFPFQNQAAGFSKTSGTPLPNLGLSTVYVITGSGTCSASEAIMNGLIGVGVKVVQIGATTCGKPYGFFPTDNCGTTYFTIQFDGVNNAKFGDYADGFIPGGTGTTANNLPGCAVHDDFSKQLGDPAEGRLAAALQYRTNGTCPIAPSIKAAKANYHEPKLVRSPARENRIMRTTVLH